MYSRFRVEESGLSHKYPPSFGTTHETNKVFGDFLSSYGSPKPFHFYEVEISLQFDDSVDLFNDAFAPFPYKMECFLNEKAVGIKQMIQGGLYSPAAFLCRKH